MRYGCVALAWFAAARALHLLQRACKKSLCFPSCASFAPDSTRAHALFRCVVRAHPVPSASSIARFPFEAKSISGHGHSKCLTCMLSQRFDSSHALRMLRVGPGNGGKHMIHRLSKELHHATIIQTLNRRCIDMLGGSGRRAGDQSPREQLPEQSEQPEQPVCSPNQSLAAAVGVRRDEPIDIFVHHDHHGNADLPRSGHRPDGGSGYHADGHCARTARRSQLIDRQMDSQPGRPARFPTVSCFPVRVAGLPTNAKTSCIGRTSGST